MSLDKAIASGKERRKPWRGADGAYGEHYGCDHCLRGRLHAAKRQEPLPEDDTEQEDAE